MLREADFPAFFQALWHYPPFAWQSRLLQQVHDQGWPSTLDLPTGSGKTATLDIAVFALALDAFRAPEARHQPRRIALVVDRRVIVDQAYDRAVQIASALDDARDGILAEVAAALRSLSGDPTALPLLPAILRGGMPRESEWARTPSQPVILVSTVDQVGSRLLFRGYGVSDRMKPVHAGLLGRDTLYLLDEVHLSRPFEETLDAVSQFYADSESSERLLPRPLGFVRMSATVAEPPADRFGLQDDDREHEKLAPRLGARKLAVLRQVRAPRDPAATREALAKAAVREVKRFETGKPRVVAVIVNRVDTARQIAVSAREQLQGWDVRLLTGRMRPLDRDRHQTGLLERIRAGRSRDDDAERTLVVSTQVVEAGADFDFDAVVTECASLDALRQRFGRLDRMGDLKKTDAVVLAASSTVDDKADPDPIYGNALRATWRWLGDVAEPSEEHDAPVVDLGIDAMEARLREAGPQVMKDLIAPRAIAPVLVSSHLDRWVQTSPQPSADPDVAPFLHGIDRGAPEVQIVWRADIAPDLLKEPATPFLREILGVAPPSALESLSVPLWAATRWLTAVAARSATDATEPAEPTTGLADVEGAAEENAEPAGTLAPAVVWRGDETSIATTPVEIRPGETLVVPSVYGGLDPVFDCWDPDATDPVVDRGDEAQLLHRGRAVLRWDAVASWGGDLSGNLAKGPQVSADDVDAEGAGAEKDAFRDWSASARRDEALPAWAKVSLDALDRGTSIARADPLTDTSSSEQGRVAWRATWRSRKVSASDLAPLRRLTSLSKRSTVEEAGPAAATEGDEGSFLGSRISLDRHLQGVRDFASGFAEALALPPAIAEDLALAGWLHDLGKADPRFQLMLHGGDPVREAAAKEPLAKSAIPALDRATRERARARAGYPKGTRHELMSVALVQHDESLRSRAHDWDLVLHLVASHHGWCRPFAPPVVDPEPVPVSVEIEKMQLGSASNHALARIDSGVADRFWRLVRCYGYWGLAWMEAIVRLADHRESEREAAMEDRNE